MNNKLHKSIMRRIWYAYTILQVKKQLTAKSFWQGAIFGSSLFIFANNVHVASVLRNTLDTPLGGVPEHLFATILNAVQSGELVKVVTLLLLVSIAISMARKINPIQIDYRFEGKV